MFVHLHIHSHYSFLDGAMRVEEIVEAARRAGMTAVALTDTNGLYAVVPFVKACRAAKIRPIVGAEIDGFDEEEIGARIKEKGERRKATDNLKRTTDNGQRTIEGREDGVGYQVSGVRDNASDSTLDVGRWMLDIRSSKLSVECSGDGLEGGETGIFADVSPPTASSRQPPISGLQSPVSRLQSPASRLQSPVSGLLPRVVVLARDREGYAEISRLVTQRRLAEEPEEETSIQNTKYEIRNTKSYARQSSFDIGAERRSTAEREYGDGWAMDPSVTFSPGPQFEGSLLDSLLALSEEHVWILTDSPPLLRLLAGRDNVFAELILTRRRRGHCRRVFDLARELNIPTVATCDVHFARPDDYPLYRLLRAIGLQKTVETLEDEHLTTQRTPAGSLCHQNQTKERARAWERARAREIVDEEHYFKTQEEVARAFRGLQAPLRNTRYIAERCDVDLSLGEWKFPRVVLPAGESAFSHLWKVTFEGLKQRYRPLTPEATRRLEFELETIGRLGFAEYFLAVNEIVAAARARGFLVLGRGSAANSIVSFALGLTPVDPLRHNLYFERFLNAERRSPPDIDLDFSWKQRDEVVRWIFDHFGHDRVALISTHITLQPRQAIREAAKAMGVAESEVNRFTRRIPGWINEGCRLVDLPVVYPECRDLPIDDEPWRSILRFAQRLIDFPRHLSIHCGGLLIAPEPITDYTPLQRAAKGPIITQMEMHAIEDLGLIKIDILSNRSLGVLDDCLQVLTKRRKEEKEEQGVRCQERAG